MNWQEFFNMGGYGFYVWTSYAVTIVVLLANVIITRLQHKQELSRLKQLVELEQDL